MTIRTEPAPLVDPTRFQLMDIGWVDEEADAPAALPRDTVTGAEEHDEEEVLAA